MPSATEALTRLGYQFFVKDGDIFLLGGGLVCSSDLYVTDLDRIIQLLKRAVPLARVSPVQSQPPITLSRPTIVLQPVHQPPVPIVHAVIAAPKPHRRQYPSRSRMFEPWDWLAKHPMSAVRTPNDEHRRTAMRLAINVSLNSLSAREERIVRLRNGINLGGELTYKAIGEQFGISANRIRQIESTALRKLKHPSRAQILRPFLADLEAA